MENDATVARAALGRGRRRRASCRWCSSPTAPCWCSPRSRELAEKLGHADARAEAVLRSHRRRRRTGRTRGARCTARRRGCARSSSSGARPAGRRARARTSRTISAFPAASPAPISRAARRRRPSASAPRSSRRRRRCEIRREDPYRKVILSDGSELTGYAVLIAPGMEVRRLEADGHRAAARRGRVLRRGAHRGGDLSRPRRDRRRRRELGGPGRDVLLAPRAQGHDARARARPRGRHVALSRRPHRRGAERRGAREHVAWPARAATAGSRR